MRFSLLEIYLGYEEIWGIDIFSIETNNHLPRSLLRLDCYCREYWSLNILCNKDKI